MGKIIILILLFPLFTKAQTNAELIRNNKDIFDLLPPRNIGYQRNDSVFAIVYSSSASPDTVFRYKITGNWNTLINKPSTFTPASHTHPYSEITGTPTIPTNNNQLTNGAGYLVAADIAGKQNTITVGSIAYNKLVLTGAILNADLAGSIDLSTKVTGNLPFASTAGASAATSATTGTMTVIMNTPIITITPTAACTFNASGGSTGQRATFFITTSGISSFTLTWGTNFKTTATLATGTTTAKVFAVSFLCTNGTQWIETGRTTAQ